MLRRLLDTLFARTKPPTTEAPSADYAGDREARRLGQLSAEDRAWADASQQRNVDNAVASAAEDRPVSEPPEPTR
jgi:hypothetical protein